MIQRDAGDGTYLGYNECDEPVRPVPPFRTETERRRALGLEGKTLEDYIIDDDECDCEECDEPVINHDTYREQTGEDA
jgi:hypothetical protein